MPRGRCVGYMEYGFMSTTSSKETALQYSGVRKAGTKPMASSPPPPLPPTVFQTPPSHWLASFCGVGETRRARGEQLQPRKPASYPHPAHAEGRLRLAYLLVSRQGGGVAGGGQG